MKDRVINLGIVAHVDAGKTTLTEQMLYACGEVREPGSVDAGSAQTDWLEVERRRGISVRAASTVLHYQNLRINLIDTPGHIDFIAEVERSLSVLDCAILIISAVEGVEAQTALLFEALKRLGIPTLIFVNKVDRTGCDIEVLLKSVKTELTENFFFCNSVLKEGSRECEVRPGLFGLVELTAEFDDTIAELYLEERTVGQTLLREKARALIAEGLIFPLVFGAAAQGKGIPCVLETIFDYFSAPAVSDKLSGIVFRVEHDKAMGKIAHTKLFGGSIKNRDSVLLNGATEQKVTQIRQFSGRKYRDTGTLYAGDIAALCGMPDVRTGDYIGEKPLIEQYRLAVPLLSVQAVPEREEELSSLVSALGELSDENPLLDFFWNREERELHIKISGKMELEVIQALLQERYQLKAGFLPPSVIYKETPKKTGRGLGHYTMPKPCWAIVELEVEPRPRGSGLFYESVIKENQIPYRYQEHIRRSVSETLTQGLFGWEVTDLAVRLIGGEHHHVHTHPLDFFVAAPMAVMLALSDCGTDLLEPYQLMQISAGEEHLNKVISEMIAMRGEFDSPIIKANGFTMQAQVPVSESMDFPVRLSAITSGKGVLSARFSEYRICPPEFGKSTKRREVNPLDRSKWILYKRNASAF